MKKTTKICLSILIVDAMVYFVLFHSGLVLPFINPTVEEYNEMQTSFSRNYAQCMYWFLAHLPASYLIARINERFLVLSAAQYPLLILGIGKVVRHGRNKKA